ncbi:MAG: class I SAM-dependent methyltransferase [Xanthomonadales bacterium]|nr:class I SAM-dependent methyltransferase [Xanthomonadales bacterium]
MNQAVPPGEFKDHFSGHAQDYARHRPGYPEALFSWLAKRCNRHQLAWDCGAGNGQASGALARHFEVVIATDPSAEQLKHAPPISGVEFRLAPAEASGLDRASVDLVAVAQALHWFDLDRFYAEVRRVLRPGGLVAAWTYIQVEVNPEVDAVVRHLYENVLGAYWPPERRLVETGYADLPFPFEPLATPAFEACERWDLAAFTGYLGSWSASRRYQQLKKANPLEKVEDSLAQAWGTPGVVRRVRWPLALRVGRHSAVLAVQS